MFPCAFPTYLKSLVGLPDLKALPDARDDVKAAVQRRLMQQQQQRKQRRYMRTSKRIRKILGVL